MSIAAECKRCKTIGCNGDNQFCNDKKKTKTPIEYFIEYLRLHKVDDIYYLINRQSIHKDFLEVIKKYEEEYIISLKKE